MYMCVCICVSRERIYSGEERAERWGRTLERASTAPALSGLLLGLVLLLEGLELLRVDGRDGHVCKVIVLVQEAVCVVVHGARDAQQHRESEQVALEEGLASPDHGGRHLPRARVLVLGGIQNHAAV